MRRPVSLLLLGLSACVHQLGQLSTAAGPVTLIDFRPEERTVLEETLSALAALEPGPLQLDAASYRSQSRFRSTFGFELSGSQLLGWWRARVDRLERGDPWTVAVHDGQHGVVLGPGFFTLPLVDRLGVLIHEARHGDGGGHPHSDCPPGSPTPGADACDDRPLGAYSFQAAFLYELYAYGLLDPRRAERGYREARGRVYGPSETREDPQ